jgi:hypothetical protein
VACHHISNVSQCSLHSPVGSGPACSLTLSSATALYSLHSSTLLAPPENSIFTPTSGTWYLDWP